jgi:hypothetical protein
MVEREAVTRLRRGAIPTTAPATFAAPRWGAASELSAADRAPRTPTAGFDFGSIAIYPPEMQIGPVGGALSPATAGRIRAKQGDGAPLASPDQRRMERTFGHNFADVRIHADGESNVLSRSLSASAFTLGSDIFLGREATNVGRYGGDHLLAHELTHVVQQRGTGRSGPIVVDPVDAPAEREAAAVARDMGADTAARTQMQPATRNHAVLQRVASTPDAPAASAEPAPPADVAAQSGFNPMDINHKLLRSIDQSDIKMIESESHLFGRYNPPMFKRHVDFEATVAALNHLTAGQIQAVKEAYYAHENRALDTDLFGLGESGFVTDLTEDQSAQLRALLGGTAIAEGASKAEQEAVETHDASAKAAELHTLLKGDLAPEDIERVMGILRQDKAANSALIAAYGRLGADLDLRRDTMRMGALEGQRAWKLLDGDSVGADAFKVGLERARIESINAKIVELAEEARGEYNPMPAIAEIDELGKERKKLVEDIEQRAAQAGAEASAGAQGDAHAAVQARVAAVLGDVGALATAVGGTDAAVIRAAADDDPVGKVATQLHKSAQAGKLTAEQLTAALRSLRAEARERAQLSLPKGDPRVEEEEKRLADDYFGRLRSAYNSLIGSGDDSKRFDDLINDTGNEGDTYLNIALVTEHGKLEDVAELVLALRDDRKDTAAVERVLRDKSAGEIKQLRIDYTIRTGGRSLDYDLFGIAPTHTGEDNPEAAGQYLIYQGKASGTSRLNLEDYMQRPDKEGGPAEVAYILARAEREYDYTIQNRGTTGAIRDTFGNEERDLLDESIKEVRKLYGEYCVWVGWLPELDPAGVNLQQPEMVHSGAAHEKIQQMQLARATIRGDRAAYEKATAELRATFQAVAIFVIQAALTALLTPAAGALFGTAVEGAEIAVEVAEVGEVAADVAEVGEAAVDVAEVGTSAETATTRAIAKFAASTSVNIASTVGANIAVYGDDYSLAMLKADLLSGLGGSIGGEAVEKMLGPVAKGLAARLGPKVSAEIIGLAKTAGSMEGGAWAQGMSGDLTVTSFIKTHLMGKAAGEITKATGSVTGLTPKSGAQAATAPEEHTTPQERRPGGAGSDEARRTSPTTTGQDTAIGSGAGPSAGRREPTTPERLPSGPRDEEPGQTSSPAATKTATTDEGRPGVRSPGSEEEQTLVNWEPDVVHELPSGSAIMFDTPAEGRQLYSKSIREDSQREVAIYRNTRTGEVVVGQGSEGEVALDLQVMHESLPGPPGTWELEAHYHPIDAQTRVTPPAQRLPSSTNGDFSALEWESQRSGNQPRTSRIDIITEGDRRNYTEFSYDPTAERPYKIDYPHPETGERTQVEFKSREAYEEWYQNQFDDARADIDAPSSGADGDNSAPSAHAPGKEGEGSGFDDEPTGVNATPVGEESLPHDIPDDELLERADLYGENIGLVQGEGVAPMPMSAEELATSNARVQAAQDVLQDRHATPERLREAIQSLFERAVAEYRASFILGGLEGGLEPGETRQLTSADLTDMCGGGRDITAEAIIEMIGNSPHKITIERIQAANLGFGAQHGFTILTLPDGTKFVIDPTFAQFADETSLPVPDELKRSNAESEDGPPLYLEGTAEAKERFTARQMLESVEGSRLARDLMRNGFAPFGREEARLYVIGLGADPATADAFAAQLRGGDAATLTEVVQNGEVTRDLKPKDAEAAIRDAEFVGINTDFNVEDLIATVTDPTAGTADSHELALSKVPEDDPLRPLLISLATRLRRLSTYLPGLGGS